MTVIIGPNNSNKTYIAYSVYGLWQALRSGFGSSLMRDALSGRKTRDNYAAKIDENFLKTLRERITVICQGFDSELEGFFQDSSSKLFGETSLDLVISDKEILRSFASKSGSRQSSRPRHEQLYEIVLQSERLEIRPLPLHKEPEQSTKLQKTRDITSFDASRMIGRFVGEALFAEPFLLPAERNAFVIAYKLLGNRRYKLLRESQREAFSSRKNEQRQLELLREAGELRYPQPVEDFLDFLTDVETEKPPATRGTFSRLAETIENSIQNSNRTRYRPTALGGKEIITEVEKGLNIDLYNASSSIKQLAPLLLYLRYRARENDLLIIDEPEMNLHPESQVRLLEVLALLVNHGVNVLVTTHSPYIMAHLNNLAQDKEASQAVKNRQAKSLYLKNAGSLLNMDQVSAYEMRDNQLHSLKEEGYGIRWNTLSDVSADLQQKYFEIYEEGHAKPKIKTARRTAKVEGRQEGQD